MTDRELETFYDKNRDLVKEWGTLWNIHESLFIPWAQRFYDDYAFCGMTEEDILRKIGEDIIRFRNEEVQETLDILEVFD